MVPPEQSEGRGSSETKLGILADPPAAPVEVGQYLREELPRLLSERLGDGRSWCVEVGYEPLPAGDLGSHDSMIEHAGKRRAAEKWDLAVCVTDLPLRDGNKALVAEVSRRQRLAIVSLPAFGVLHLRRRVTEVVVELVRELLEPDQDSGQQRTKTLGDRDLPGPFHLVAPARSDIDARVLASQASVRLLAGMVADNRPWRLLRGLRGAIAAAFAFSAFWLVNSVVWQLAVAHSFWRLSIISGGTVATMVVWLILYHRLWISTRSQDIANRGQAVLFNASTVLTLLIGVSIAYVALLVFNFMTANLVIAEEVLSARLQRPVGIFDYAKLSWFATSGATVAGALGTGFATEQSVRQAAYSRREQERRAQFEREADDQQTEGDSAAEA